MAFELPDLPYPHDALAAKGMCEETLKLHHDIHHKTYIDKANDMAGSAGMDGKSLEEIVVATYGDESKSGLFNNASQAWNHNQFWAWMTPKDVAMPGELKSAIDGAFGSLDGFKKAFSEAGAGQFGSGWAWLVVDGGQLKVTKTPNGVNPLCFGQTALLGCDVWEHSYYLDFRNKRPAYLDNFLDKLVDWENVAGRLAKAG